MTWWTVKVYDEESRTYTYLNREAECVEDIQAELAEEGLWIFVDATPEEDGDTNFSKVFRLNIIEYMRPKE